VHIAVAVYRAALDKGLLNKYKILRLSLSTKLHALLNSLATDERQYNNMLMEELHKI